MANITSTLLESNNNGMTTGVSGVLHLKQNIASFTSDFNELQDTVDHSKSTYLNIIEFNKKVYSLI